MLLDLEIKQGDDNKKQVRSLFERVTSSKLKAKKSKFFFKKWLEFEEKAGDKKTQERVKAKAAEYIRLQKSERGDDAA